MTSVCKTTSVLILTVLIINRSNVRCQNMGLRRGQYNEPYYGYGNGNINGLVPKTRNMNSVSQENKICACLEKQPTLCSENCGRGSCNQNLKNQQLESNCISANANYLKNPLTQPTSCTQNANYKLPKSALQSCPFEKTAQNYGFYDLPQLQDGLKRNSAVDHAYRPQIAIDNFPNLTPNDRQTRNVMSEDFSNGVFSMKQCADMTHGPNMKTQYYSLSDNDTKGPINVYINVPAPNLVSDKKTCTPANSDRYTNGRFSTSSSWNAENSAVPYPQQQPPQIIIQNSSSSYKNLLPVLLLALLC